MTVLERIGDWSNDTITIIVPSKSFCPTGPGGGVDPSCGSGRVFISKDIPEADAARIRTAMSAIPPRFLVDLSIDRDTAVGFVYNGDGLGKGKGRISVDLDDMAGRDDGQLANVLIHETGHHVTNGWERKKLLETFLNLDIDSELLRNYEARGINDFRMSKERSAEAFREYVIEGKHKEIFDSIGKSYKSHLLTETLLLATDLVNLKRAQFRSKVRRLINGRVFEKQLAETERELIKALVPFFEDQVEEIASKVDSLDVEKAIDTDQARKDLINTVFPVLARSMSEAAVAQMMMLGIDIRKKRKGAKAFCPTGPGGGVDPSCGFGSTREPLTKENIHLIEGVFGFGLMKPEEHPGLRKSAGYKREMAHFESLVPKVGIELSIKAYQASRLYTTRNYGQMNRKLRAGKEPKGTKEIDTFVHSASLNKESVLYRGVSRSFLDHLKKIGEGGSFHDSAFVSTSVSKKVAEHFSKRTRKGGILVIEKAKGRGAYAPDSIYSDTFEGEVVLPRKSTFKINRIDGDAIYIQIEEAKSFTKSTASQWLNSHQTATPPGVMVESPQWMKDRISSQLADTFDQPYWDGITQTTLDDVEGVLREGLSEGESIAAMAKKIKEELGDEYYHNRSKTIARTEAGNALNGARKGAMDALRDAIPEVDMRAEWLSVLGTTTRDTHAHLDGVPEDKNGKWYLGGKHVPWPGHYSLPAGERCNCQCSLITSYGMDEDDALQEIQQYQDRLDEMEERAVDRLIEKTFCPTGPGGGVDPHCSPDRGGSGGGGHSHSELVPVGYNKASEKWELPHGKALPSHLPKRIPPAWTDVHVSMDPDASLLVKGRDSKGRVQSVYSATHAENKKAIKFVRVNELRAKQDAVRDEIYRDIKRPETKEAASALALIEHTGLRPGGEGNTQAEKQAYGATTLEGRHVKELKGGVRLRFVGKKGVDLDIPVTDPKIVDMLLSRKAAAGPRDKLFDTNDSKLREYTEGKDGGGFLPKDFRTAKGTNVAVEEIAKRKVPKTEKEYKKAVKEVAIAVSKQLGNTPTIALQSYIDPAVFAKWRLK